MHGTHHSSHGCGDKCDYGIRDILKLGSIFFLEEVEETLEVGSVVSGLTAHLVVFLGLVLRYTLNRGLVQYCVEDLIEMLRSTSQILSRGGFSRILKAPLTYYLLFKLSLIWVKNYHRNSELYSCQKLVGDSGSILILSDISSFLTTFLFLGRVYSSEEVHTSWYYGLLGCLVLAPLIRLSLAKSQEWASFKSLFRGEASKADLLTDMVFIAEQVSELIPPVLYDTGYVSFSEATGALTFYFILEELFEVVAGIRRLNLDMVYECTPGTFASGFLLAFVHYVRGTFMIEEGASPLAAVFGRAFYSTLKRVSHSLLAPLKPKLKTMIGLFSS